MDLATWLHAAGGPLLLVGAWPWWEVWLLASIPATLGHQIYYLIGRRFGNPLLARLPDHWHPALARAARVMRRHETRVLLTMRFAYGIRLPLPILCGVTGVPLGKFIAYNVGTALGWALLFTLLGWGFGEAAAAAFQHYAHYQVAFLGASLGFATVTHIISRHLGNRLLEGRP
jgi:membrane protein DedA with SNARE-associated domain